MKTGPTIGDPYLGTTIGGKYRLTEQIGAGVMGRVYRARHLQLDSDVALKLVNPEATADPQTAARFQREARATSRLRHPNIISVLDFGQTETGLLYLVTEMLTGRTLARIMREEPPMQYRRMVDLLGQALVALEAAHTASVIHRDFKPENIFVETLRTGEEHVKVLDFGIAKLRGTNDPQLTASGSVCGTPDYMSPEQIQGNELDARSDVYAAGIVLYELLTGSRPFRGPLIDVLRMHAHEPPEPPKLRRTDLPIPPPIETVCLRAIAKAREERFASAEEMRTALLETLRDDPLRCEACGSSVPLGAHFCPRCGAGVEDSLDVPPALATPPVTLAFVARAEQLAALQQLERGALLVVGPGGAGKSRLVDEWRARLPERPVIMRPDPTGAQESWRPVRRALAQVLQIGERPTEAELLAATEERKTDRTGLVEVFGLQAAPPAAEVELRRREAIAAAVGVLREDAGTLVCEDADRYDRRSLDVVARLLVDPGTARVVVTAARRGDLATATTVMLEPLPPGAIESLGGTPGEHEDGMPLTVEQRLRAKVEGAADASPQARLALLPPNARRLLAALVVGGFGAETATLQELLRLGDVTSAALLLGRRGFLRHDGSRLELTSPTLRDRLYEALEPGERRALHQAWLQVLAARGRGPMVLAHHEWSADPQAATVALMERAAAAADRAGDATGSARWRARLLERLRASAAGPSEIARAAVAAGDAHAQAGDPARAHALYEEALALLGDLGDPRVQALARRGLGRVAIGRRELPEAAVELRRALDRAEDADSATLVGELALELAELLARLGRGSEGEDALATAASLAADVPAVMWRLRLAAGERARERGHVGDALDLCRLALVDAERVSPAAVARVRAQLAATAQAAGDPAVAATHRRAAMEALDRLGDRRGMAELLLVAALADTRDASVSRRWIAQAGELARQVGWREGVTRAREALRRLE